MRTFNVRYCPLQERFHGGKLIVRHQWKVLKNPCRAYAVIEWADLGKIQLVYLKKEFPDNEMHCNFISLFNQTWPIPKVLNMINGMGKEVLLQMTNKDRHFIRVFDYPDTHYGSAGGRDDGTLSWLGDFPLYTHFKIADFTFLEITALHFRFDSHDAHASSYLCKYEKKDTCTIYYDIIRVACKPPQEWRRGRGARNGDRTSQENYFTERMCWRPERYMEANELENCWENVTVVPLENSSPQLIPLQIAVLNSQKVLGVNGKKRFRISLKSIPQYFNTGDVAWPDDQYGGEFKAFFHTQSLGGPWRLVDEDLHDSEMQQIVKQDLHDSEMYQIVNLYEYNHL